MTSYSHLTLSRQYRTVVAVSCVDPITPDVLLLCPEPVPPFARYAIHYTLANGSINDLRGSTDAPYAQRVRRNLDLDDLTMQQSHRQRYQGQRHGHTYELPYNAELVYI